MKNVTVISACEGSAQSSFIGSSRMAARPLACSLALTLFSLPVPVAAEEAQYDVDKLNEMSLEELLDITMDAEVTTASKTKGTLRDSPAVVTVVTADQIRVRGYSSIVEVLQNVPGFYDVYDLVYHNIGVRGINGGARASGNILKVMIDGQAISFRPTTGNYFGEELVPMAAVARVEVIRGPASALYGSNALLGVVNIITKSGADINGVHLFGQGGFLRDRPLGGGAVVVGASTDELDVLVAVSFLWKDRSGLTLPESSPLFRSSRGAFFGIGESTDDLESTRSVLAKASLNDVVGGRLEVWGAHQYLEAVGEFQDFEPLTHRTRIATANDTVRLGYSTKPLEDLEIRFNASGFNSAPDRRERFNLGEEDKDLIRNVRASGFELKTEITGSFADSLTCTLGVDFLWEEHVQQTYKTRLRQDITAADGTVWQPKGTIIPGDETGRKYNVTNIGAMGELRWQMLAALTLTGGFRLDHHSIYDTQLSPRVGVVLAAPEHPFHAKLLFGTSFKAPSAEQMYTTPMRYFDIRGNEQLVAQTARTGELVGGYEFGSWGHVLANVFVTQVEGRVQYRQRGLYLEATNEFNEWLAGAEIDARLRPFSFLRFQVGAGFARSLVRRRRLDSVVVSGFGVDQPLFPVAQVHIGGDFTWEPWWNLTVSAEVSYISERQASESNAALSGDAYSLDGYARVAVSLSLAERFWGERQTRFGVRANLLGGTYSEPGFNGIDLPSPGLQVMFQLGQEF